MKNFYISTMCLIVFVSCSNNETATSSDSDAQMKQTYFTEFMACKAGPDYSAESMTRMISEWQNLLTDESLVGAWGYVPAVETNSRGDTLWWELQWTSQESADIAWSNWVQNEDASLWDKKYKSVLDCNGENRSSYDVAYPIASNAFGELPDSGYFYAEVHMCEYNEGSSKKDAINFLPGFSNAVNQADYSDTSYHYGNYFQQGNDDVFLWGNFTNSKDSMDKVNEAFEESVRDSMFPIFSEFASCGEVPDLYHGWTLYWSADKNFIPKFPSN